MSDSPLPVPSGYICHTSYAVGKGRQPQQHDCPSSHPPYTATPISPPRANIYWSPSKASFCILLSLSLSLLLQPLSPSSSLSSTTSARSFAANLFLPCFFSPPPTFHPIFQEKEKHAQDGFSLPSRCQVDARSCSSRYFLYSRLEGRVERGGEGGRRRFEEHSRHDENSPHDSFILGNECLPRSGGNVPLTLEIRRNPRGWTERHLCASPRINLRILPAKLSNPSTFFYFRIANNLFRGHCFL